ncbi:ankyrin repeat-containing domain protein, partial [Coprinopsis sp. MPI-PUGE-AT-0042]
LLGRTDVDVHQVHPNGLTLLMLAASRGHIAVVDVLLAQRAIDADTKNARGETALMLAVREGHIEVTRRLLGRADVDVHQVQPDGLTLLMLAASRGYTTVVDVLLTRLAVDADAKNARGETALMLAVQEGHIEVTLRLLGLTDVVVHQDGLISDLLLRQPAIDVNATNNSGETALMLAARWGRTKIAHRLLQVPHMELLQKDLNGRSAFMLAVFHRQIDVLRMFLSLIQFAVNVAEKEGHSTLDLPERGDRGIAVDVELNQPGVDFNIEGMGDVDATLMVAARGSDLKRLRRLLAFPPYTVNLKFIDGASPTALNLAFRSSARPNSVVLIFIKRPGLVQSRNLRSSRPALGMPTADSAGHDLLAAAKCGDVEIVDRLFAEDSKLDPNLKDLDGWTALMWATWHARIGVVQRLLRHEKIDVGAFSHTGLDARDIAMRRGLSDILEVIERAVLTVSHSTHPPQNLDSSTTRDAEVAAFEVVFGSHHVPEGVIGQEYSEEGAEVDEIQLLNLNNMDLSS